MKTSLLAVLSLLVLAGCDLPGGSAQAGPKNDKAQEANGVAWVAKPPAQTYAADDILSSPTNAAPVPPTPAELNLPSSTLEVIRLAHQQLGDGVLTNFIAAIKEPFQLDSDQIVYLRDVGVSPSIIEALLIKQQQLDTVSTSSSETKSREATSTAPATQIAYASPLPPPATHYPGGTVESQEPQVGPAVPAAQPAPEEAQPVVNNFNFFYDSLAPYGNWITVPSYGYVWQPSCAVITPGWRPYWNNGGWVWSDCGWFWNSSYSWGWAPFHYGNWFNSPGVGWCWAPGSVWGPSWVTFRYSAGYCGWAPLPPGCGWQSGIGLTWAGSGIGVSFGFGFSAANYCWTPTGYFAAQNCANFGLAGNNASQIYNNSQVINNYIVGNNNTIINGGIDPGQIQKHSRNEIRKVQLSDSSSPTGATSRVLSRPGSQDSHLSVYRPTVSPGNSAPQTLAARSELRPGTAVPRTSGIRSDIPSRNPIKRSEPSTAARIDIPAGAGSPLGSPVRLLDRPGNQSSIPSATTPRAAIASPTSPGSIPSPATRTEGQNRYARYPGQDESTGATRLEPRKIQPSGPSDGIVSATPARIPSVMNNGTPRPSVTSQSPARNPPGTRTSTMAARAQPTETRINAAQPAATSTRSFNAPQASRPAYSAPTMSSGSRPQFSAGGGGAASSGGSLSRPSARP